MATQHEGHLLLDNSAGQRGFVGQTALTTELVLQYKDHIWKFSKGPAQKDMLVTFIQLKCIQNITE